MNHASLKKSMIIAMASIPEVEGFETNNLILTTPAGLICGKLISEDETTDSNKMNNLMAKVCNNFTEKYLKDISDSDSEPIIEGNDGYLFLQDVTIRSTSSNATSNLPFMIVFYDQIIGVSIGNDG